MFNWVYVSATNEFLSGGPCDVTPIAGQALATLSRNTNPRRERYDGAGGIRAATLQEISDYDAARQADSEQGAFDGQKMVKAVAIYFAQQTGVPLQTAKAGILAVYRGL